MRKRINFHRLAGTKKKNLLIIYSKIYSEFSSELAPHESVAANVERLWFTFSRLGGTCFLEPQITLITLILNKLQI